MGVVHWHEDHPDSINDNFVMVTHLEWRIENESDETITDCRVGPALADIQFHGPRKQVAAAVHGGHTNTGCLELKTQFAMRKDAFVPNVELIFVDAAGVTWRRDSRGTLTRSALLLASVHLLGAVR